MQVITGVALLAMFTLSGVVGIRLLRIPTQAKLAPERLLGLFFLVANVLGGVLVTAAYGIWTTMGKAETIGWVSQLHGMGQFCMSFGYAMVVLFTQQTFHRESRAAKGVAWSVIGLLVVSLAARVIHEGFAISVSPGAFHWMGYGCRMFALVWASWASLRYWLQMRKRVQLGLADPLVSNRFLLWALWGSGNCMTALAEPAARVAYDWFAGGNATSAEAIQGIGGPVITITLCISSLLAIYTTIVLWLAFFPSDRYRGWITERAQRRQAVSPA